MKKIVKIAFMAAFAVIVGYNMYAFQKTSKLSDLALNNVEALANAEASDCYGCASRNTICHDWGWGGCLGMNAIINM